MATRNNIIEEFLDGATKGKASSLKIDGNKIYSYWTAIARREGNIIYLNKKKYSMTTTTQTNAIRRTAESKGMQVIEVEEGEV